jgi:hypothetical protein
VAITIPCSMFGLPAPKLSWKRTASQGLSEKGGWRMTSKFLLVLFPEHCMKRRSFTNISIERAKFSTAQVVLSHERCGVVSRFTNGSLQVQNCQHPASGTDVNATGAAEQERAGTWRCCRMIGCFYACRNSPLKSRCVHREAFGASSSTHEAQVRGSVCSHLPFSLANSRWH